jgi:hypothetical protein
MKHNMDLRERVIRYSRNQTNLGHRKTFGQ